MKKLLQTLNLLKFKLSRFYTNNFIVIQFVMIFLLLYAIYLFLFK
jgi:hypothetical protein